MVGLHDLLLARYPVATHLKTASFLEAANLLCWGGSVEQSDASLVGQHLDAAAFPFLALLSCSTMAQVAAAVGRRQQATTQVSVLDHMEGVGRVGVETVSHSDQGACLLVW